MIIVIVGGCAAFFARRKDSSAASDSVADQPQETTDTASTTASAPAPTSTTPVYNVDTCLSLFTLSAPSAPTTYPCGPCTPAFQAIPNDLATSSGNTTGVGAALQFCALQAIFAGTSGATTGKRAGVLDGWMENVNPCSGWDGVTCDKAGRITELYVSSRNICLSLY